jgi:Arc/MetJ-type ribon-helix-helix transcriptional regulator
MNLGRNISVRLPKEVEQHLQFHCDQKGPGTKMSEIIRPILWEWYKSEMASSGIPIQSPRKKAKA